MSTLTLQYDEIAAVIDPGKVIEAIQDIYGQFYRGAVQMPFPYHFEPTDDSVVHIKSAVRSGDQYVVKIASYFPGNPSKGLTSILGLVMLFDGNTGEPAMVLFDNALLTHHRTAAAGAVGARLLARQDSTSALVVGVGTQGTLQIDYLLRVRDIKTVTAYARKPEAVASYLAQQSKKHPGVDFRAATGLGEACREADIIVTTTPNREPLLMAGWIEPGTHVTAVGSDNPGKQELDPALLKKSLYVTDSTPQCAKNGELQHAIAAGVLTEADVHAEIGAIVVGDKPGRTDPESITVFDSTGLGAQDLAIVNLVYDSCRKE
jgi:ornithine cyclodeaminase/alanine dehydrogenase-like protein (mu-crystallin family)